MGRNFIYLSPGKCNNFSQKPHLILKANARHQSWKDICNTARFFGCFDERYVAVLVDLVMHEELDAFDVAQWLGETNNGTKSGL